MMKSLGRIIRARVVRDNLGYAIIVFQYQGECAIFRPEITTLLRLCPKVIRLWGSTEAMMNLKSLSLSTLSIDDLSKLHEQVGLLLSDKIEQQKRKLDEQLARLSGAMPLTTATVRRSGAKQKPRRGKVRQPYPPVRPKFRNPADPVETWSGRGKQPRWLVAQLKAGKKIEDFAIAAKPHRARAAKRA